MISTTDNMKTQHSFNWSRWLAVATWTLFTVSFMLPAYQHMRGFECAFKLAFFWSQAIRGDWAAIYYLLLSFLNLLMLTSPILLLRNTPDARCLRVLRVCSLIALILIGSFLFLLYPKGMVPFLRVGSYAWASAFALLYFATLATRGSRKERVALGLVALCA